MNAATRAFDPLLGLPCWGVSWNRHTGLWLNFGTPRLDIRDPRPSTRARTPRVRRLLRHRLITVEGRWRFAIMTGRWRLQLLDEPRAVTSDGASRRIERQIAFLDGQALETATVDTASGTTELRFDHGAVLMIRGSDADDGELWTLYRPRHRHVSLRRLEQGQAEVAQGRTTDPERWIPLQASDRSGAP